MLHQRLSQMLRYYGAERHGLEGVTLTQIMVVFFLPLFGHHPCVVFCPKKSKKNHKNTRINKSRRRMNGLAMHTDLETERQQIQKATEGPVGRRTISRFEGSSAPGSE